MSEIIPYSKKGQRKISSFVGHELLYDYLADKLDEERKKAVAELVSHSREAQIDMQKIKSGAAYADLLKEIKVTEALVEKIKTPTTYFQVGLQKLKLNEWPAGARIALEAFVVAIGIVSVAIVVPWHKLLDMKLGTSSEVVLTEISRDQLAGSKSESELVMPGDKTDSTTYPDEGSGKQTKKEIVQSTQEPNVIQFNLDQTVAALPQPKVTTKGESAIEQAKPVEVVARTKPEDRGEQGAATKTSSAAATTPSAPTSEKRQGFLYRGTIAVTNVSSVTPKYVEKIQELGGRKAGSVELGWKKGTGSYFHFTIPEAKYPSLVEFMNQFGKLKIEKEQHERVMPDGIIRLIIQVEEKGQ
ncbi:MAG: hypothetical protein BroJett040_19230 [Oligoflexia bacterium]|nr:MAG: hypothetical protein BroJett040_19230 [Oligoflexia bacterium]